MNLAITTDWLVTHGGAEQVIDQMHQLWPDAPVYTTVHKPGSVSVPDESVRASGLQKWYQLYGKHRVLLPWMPRAVESWCLENVDVVLSSSHAVAKGCIPPSTATHICYCHTPMRYAWDMENQYLDDFHVPSWIRKKLKHQLMKLRRWDLSTAKRVDVFIANSTTVQERIQRIYNRESIVLHPPVHERFFTHDIGKSSDDPSYLFAVGRLVPYKRFDLLIQTANEMRTPLKIAGMGPEYHTLVKMAGPTVEFLGYVPDDELPQLYARASAFLFPVEEDAGIAPLEAQACGTPVIALEKGGALDTVIGGTTGIFFKEQSVQSLRKALDQLANMQFDREVIRSHAEQFRSDRFREKLKRIVESESQ